MKPQYGKCHDCAALWEVDKTSCLRHPPSGPIKYGENTFPQVSPFSGCWDFIPKTESREK